MNTQAYEAGNQAYSAGRFEEALEQFMLCCGDMEGMSRADTSRLYQLVGNCYLKQKRSQKAADFYRRALAVAPDAHKAAISNKLGSALLNCRQYEKALEAFDAALLPLKAEDGVEHVFATPYKAHTGRARALLKLGNTVEAGAAFREAALDTANPAKEKSLFNLAACFMDLGRAADAAASYEAALGFAMAPDFKGKLHAGLAQAQLAQGQLAAAVASFEAAAACEGFELTGAANHDFEMARTLLDIQVKNEAARTAAWAAQIAQDAPSGQEAAGETPAAEGEPAQPAEPAADPAPTNQPAAVTAEFEPVAQQPASTFPFTPVPYASAGAEEHESNWADESMPLPSPEDTSFFDLSEAQIEARARHQAKSARKRSGCGLKLLLTVLVLAIVLAAAGASAFFLGYGWPLQEEVAAEFALAAAAGNNTTDYWAESVNAADQASQEAMLAGVTSAEAIAVERSAAQTAVWLECTLESGGTQYFEIILLRDGVSWAVEYVELYFPSEH